MVIARLIGRHINEPHIVALLPHAFEKALQAARPSVEPLVGGVDAKNDSALISSVVAPAALAFAKWLSMSAWASASRPVAIRLASWLRALARARWP